MAEFIFAYLGLNSVIDCWVATIVLVGGLGWLFVNYFACRYFENTTECLIVIRDDHRRPRIFLKYFLPALVGIGFLKFSLIISFIGFFIIRSLFIVKSSCINKWAGDRLRAIDIKEEP